MAGCVWFEPTTGVEFDIRADLTYADSIAAEMLEWAYVRRREFAPALAR